MNQRDEPGDCCKYACKDRGAWRDGTLRWLLPCKHCNSGSKIKAPRRRQRLRWALFRSRMEAQLFWFFRTNINGITWWWLQVQAPSPSRFAMGKEHRRPQGAWFWRQFSFDYGVCSDLGCRSVPTYSCTWRRRSHAPQLCGYRLPFAQKRGRPW